jgi:hypothetical protein
VFVGLTLFTFQTKLDFSSFGPFLFAGVMGLITASLVGIFLPFGQTTDLVIACIGVLIFSGFVLYDTQNIMKRLSVDEAILGEWSAIGVVWNAADTRRAQPLPRLPQPLPVHSAHRELSSTV